MKQKAKNIMVFRLFKNDFTMSEHVDKQKSVRDLVIDEIHGVINRNGTNKILHYLEDESNPSLVKSWISCGNSLLDIAVSNRKDGGLPTGRIIEIHGEPASGKTLFCGHICHETQKQGGLPVFIDTEAAASTDYLKKIGVDLENMVYASAHAIEEAFEISEKIIDTFRKNDKNRLLTIIIDSIAGASTKKELLAGYHEIEHLQSNKALLISKALRKITNLIAKEKILFILTNHLKEKTNHELYDDPYFVPGGKAIPFHASVRIRLQIVKEIKNDGNQTIGLKCVAKIIKNKIAPPNRIIPYQIIYENGIDNWNCWLDYLIENNIAKINNDGELEIKINDEEIIKTRSNEWKNLKNDSSFRQTIYEKIYKTMTNQNGQ